MRRLRNNELGPEGGMALAEALKRNTTLEQLWSAALPSNPLAHTFSLHSTHVLCTCSFSPFLCRVRRLGDTKLGPKGGMALAEALKSNTTLKELGSAALPIKPARTHARSLHSMHPQCTCPFSPFPLPGAQARQEPARPRGRHGAR